MRKLFTLITLFLFCNLIRATKVQMIPGYYINNNNDTVRVTFEVKAGVIISEKAFRDLQRKIKYHESDGKSKVLKPNQAKEACFPLFGQDLKMVSCRNTVTLAHQDRDGGRIFLRKAVEGRLELFVYYPKVILTGASSNGAGGAIPSGSGETEKLYLQRKGTDHLIKGDVKNYLDDCPAAMEKVNSGQYDDLSKRFILTDYNSLCK